MPLPDNMPLDQIGDLKRQLRDLERAVREMRAERRLEAATIGAGGLTVKGGKIAVVDPDTGKTLALLDPSGLSVDGTATIGGDLNVTGTETVSGNLNVTGTETVSGNLSVTGKQTIGGDLGVTGPAKFGGDTEIGGNAKITGTLSLPAGIIDNDALANPTSFGFGGNSGTGFAVGTSQTVRTSIPIPIPSGFTRALVHCTVNATANNSTAASDFLYVAAKILAPSGYGGIGGEAFSGVPAGGWGNAAASAAGSYTDIGTGSIVLSCLVRAGTAWAATGANIANVDGTVIFLR